MSELSDLAMARQGDTAAFERLVTPHEGMVWRVCWQLMSQTEDAQDAMQETMLRAWRSLGGYRGEASFSTWLYRVAVSCCLDALRRRKPQQQRESVEELSERGFDVPDGGPGPQEALEKGEQKEALRRAMKQLPEEQRVPLVLFAVEGRPYEEIASLTGVSVGTVKSRISRGREKLKEILRAGGNFSAPAASNKVKGGQRA